MRDWCRGCASAFQAEEDQLESGIPLKVHLNNIQWLGAILKRGVTSSGSFMSNEKLEHILNEIIAIDDAAKASETSIACEDALDGVLLERWERVSARARRLLRESSDKKRSN